MFVTLSLYYLAGELWIAVSIAVIIGEVSAEITASAVAVFFLVIQLGGGNAPLLVPFVTDMLGSLKAALILLYPGAILLSAAVFSIALIFAKSRPPSTVDNPNNDIAITDECTEITEKDTCLSDRTGDSSDL